MSRASRNIRMEDAQTPPTKRTARNRQGQKPLGRPPEIGPPCLRVLPARDKGQRRTEAGEEAKAHPRTDHPQAAHCGADALRRQDPREAAKALEVSEQTCT